MVVRRSPSHDTAVKADLHNLPLFLRSPVLNNNILATVLRAVLDLIRHIVEARVFLAQVLVVTVNRRHLDDRASEE